MESSRRAIERKRLLSTPINDTCRDGGKRAAAFNCILLFVAAFVNLLYTSLIRNIFFTSKTKAQSFSDFYCYMSMYATTFLLLLACFRNYQVFHALTLIDGDFIRGLELVTTLFIAISSNLSELALWAPFFTNIRIQHLIDAPLGTFLLLAYALTLFFKRCVSSFESQPSVPLPSPSHPPSYAHRPIHNEKHISVHDILIGGILILIPFSIEPLYIVYNNTSLVVSSIIKLSGAHDQIVRRPLPPPPHSTLTLPYLVNSGTVILVISTICQICCTRRWILWDRIIICPESIRLCLSITGFGLLNIARDLGKANGLQIEP